MPKKTSRVVGYCVAVPGEEKTCLEERVRAIRARGEELPGVWKLCALEHPTHTPASWRERPVLTQLLDALNWGDQLVVSRPDQIDRAPGRLAEAFGYLARRHIWVHFLDFRGEQLCLAPEVGHAVALLLAKCVKMSHENQSHISREAARRRKELGMAVGGSPGYGKRRVKRGRCKCDEWCPKQCAIIRELKIRRDAGEAWEQIAADFHKRRLRTGGNRPWVRKRSWKGHVSYEMSRLYRAYRWYRALLGRGEELGG